jgi:hypothetical protein
MLSLSALKWHHKAVADAVFAFRALVPTGIMLVCPSAFSLVVVEGVPKALKRYHKLMLRRIDWTDTPTLPGQQEQEDEEEEEERPRPDKPANSCHLVWEVRLVLRLTSIIQEPGCHFSGGGGPRDEGGASGGSDLGVVGGTSGRS